MSNGTGNAKLQTLLLTGNAGKESTLRIVGERTTQGIANLIAEGSNAMQLVHVGLHGKLFLRISTLASTPSLSIYKYGGVYLVHFVANEVHRLNVVNAHQVEAEAVDVVLANPILHTLQHEATHHRTLRGRLVSTARAVAIGSTIFIKEFSAHHHLLHATCRMLPLFSFAIIVIGERPLEITVNDVVSMVVDHVEDDADASLVERLHHLLELADATRGVIGIGAVGTFRHVVVHRVVAPVVLIVLQPHFIH